MQWTLEKISAVLQTQALYQLTIGDLLFLVLLGILWSALVWFVTEWAKRSLEIEKPRTKNENRVIKLVPVLASGVIVCPFYPYLIEGVGQPVEPSLALYAFTFGVGALGGIGAKVAHDYVREAMTRTFGWALERLTGADDE